MRYKGIGILFFMMANILSTNAEGKDLLVPSKTDTVTIDTLSTNNRVSLPLPNTLVNKQIDRLVEYARKYIGTPYRRGSKGPNRYLQGISVKDEEICRGDLVFFKGRNSRRSNVGHVGLVTEVYPDGRFKFIHASTSQGIREDWNFSPYYAQRYVGARRIYFVQIDKRLILDAILELEDINDNTPFTETEKSITPQEFSTFVRAE